MPAISPLESEPPPRSEPDALVLRPSVELSSVPTSRTALPASVQAATGSNATSQDTIAEHPQHSLDESPMWMLIGLAAVASAGWIVERRRRRELETEKDSVLWADVQPAASSLITNLEEIPQDAADAPTEPQAGPMTLPTTTASSRREATLIELQQLDGKLRRRRARGDVLAATLLLQQHLADFRYTSPWVFLELRELHHVLRREQEWNLAREAFRARFGQRAPVWQAPSTAHVELADDALICDELIAQWPYREARMVIRRWTLGEQEVPAEQQPAPVLALGVYRDLLLLDRVLDRMMLTRPPPEDSLL
jgi:hypothetical protein